MERNPTLVKFLWIYPSSFFVGLIGVASVWADSNDVIRIILATVLVVLFVMGAVSLYVWNKYVDTTEEMLDEALYVLNLVNGSK